jgi:hypothetical protein
VTSHSIQLIPICTSNLQAKLAAIKATSAQLSEQNNHVDETYKKHTTSLPAAVSPSKAGGCALTKLYTGTGIPMFVTLFGQKCSVIKLFTASLTAYWHFPLISLGAHFLTCFPGLTVCREMTPEVDAATTSCCTTTLSFAPENIR